MKKIKISPSMPSEVKIHQVGKNEIQIVAYPFESGYVVSLAHPLRRLLLGSSVGFAPVAIKIEGVAHEFDSLRGMIEDVALFIINLKNIRFKLKNGANKAEISYSFKGPKQIHGKDLESEEVQIVTPEAYLASLNEDAVLNFSLVVHKGMGYVPSEEIRDELPQGYIPLDAYFTPVRKAVYAIEKMLVEDSPNYEKLVFNIATDGQIDPLSAFKEALGVMYKQMSIFNTELNISESEASEESENPELKKLLQKIEDLGLSARSFNCLERAGIKYVGELVLMGEDELGEVKNLGKKSLDEIKEKLEEIGYPFSQELTNELSTSLRKKLEKLKS